MSYVCFNLFNFNFCSFINENIKIKGVGKINEQKWQIDKNIKHLIVGCGQSKPNSLQKKLTRPKILTGQMTASYKVVRLIVRLSVRLYGSQHYLKQSKKQKLIIN
ncbi:hypothetical protein BpHYR1_009688 [Brachionus plicatilis]|uniref:Uncharacterized protein n=1 Tax=Brachionus plicatilis TaxID=10195 RepID=A0A3M7RJW5_BRAPC|nr:hypothetical protein BpHYR1_009688 [Brachionus plicatilis]